MVYRNPNVMRAENVLEGMGPGFGQFPVALVTRRTWSLQADEVINRRETAPNAIWDDTRANSDAREIG